MDMNVINTVVQSIASSGSSMAGNLLGTGTALAGALAVVMLGWHIVLWLLESPVEEIFGSAVRLVMKGAIVTWIMLGYVNTLAGLNVKQMFSEGMNTITARMIGDAAASDTLSAGVSILAKSIVTVKNGIFSAKDDPAASTATPAAPADQASGFDFFKSLSPINLIKLLLKLFLGLIVILILTLTLGIYVLVNLLGDILVFIGLAIGPILIPWLLWEASEFLFNGWLKFMIAAGLIKVVSAAMLKLTQGVLDGLTEATKVIGDSMLTDAGIDILASVLMVLFAGFVGVLMWMVPNISNGLVSGNISVSGILGQRSFNRRVAR